MEAKPNVGWVDILRIGAIVAVVYSHTCDSFIAEFTHDLPTFYTGVFMECLVRPCVVLMTMITGHLLLPLHGDRSLGACAKKRVGRILVPLVFWALVLPVIFCAYYQIWGQNSTNPSVTPSAFTTAGMWEKILSFPLNFNYDTTPLWYLYMLIGVYLVLPVVDAWLRTATKRDLQLWLTFWAATLFFPYVRFFAPMLLPSQSGHFMPLLGECDWNAFNAVYYAQGFLGYILLAYYLKTYPLQWSWRKTWIVAASAYLTGYAITSGGYIAINGLFPGDYTYLEIPWTMCGINVCLQAIGIYLIVSRLHVHTSPSVQRLAKLMFGVYLCHFPFVHIFYDLFATRALPVPLRITAITTCAFLVSLCLVWTLWQNRFTRRLVA